ncbi:MAG: hypothetical protein ACPGXZ_00835 [Saprospiraceae bacterium]
MNTSTNIINTDYERFKQKLNHSGWHFHNETFIKEVISGKVAIKINEQGELIRIAAQLWNEKEWSVDGDVVHYIKDVHDVCNIEQVFPMIGKLGVYRKGEDPIQKELDKKVKEELEKQKSNALPSGEVQTLF